MCIWLRHSCNEGNSLLNQHFQKTNCTIITPGSSMCLCSNPFSRLQKDTHDASTQLWEQGPNKDSLPNNFCSSSQEQWEQLCPPPTQEQVTEPSTHSTARISPLPHFPSPTPWSPGEGGTINSARCKWGRILERDTKSFQPKFTGNKSTHHSLLIDYLMNLLFWTFAKDVKEKNHIISKLQLPHCSSGCSYCPAGGRCCGQHKCPPSLYPQLHYLSQTCWIKSSWEPIEELRAGEQWCVSSTQPPFASLQASIPLPALLWSCRSRSQSSPGSVRISTYS